VSAEKAERQIARHAQSSAGEQVAADDLDQPFEAAPPIRSPEAREVDENESITARGEAFGQHRGQV
jgi:hypothetical protein